VTTVKKGYDKNFALRERSKWAPRFLESPRQTTNKPKKNKKAGREHMWKAPLGGKAGEG